MPTCFHYSDEACYCGNDLESEAHGAGCNCPVCDAGMEQIEASFSIEDGKVTELWPGARR
jgi:hypothetical protein